MATSSEAVIPIITYSYRVRAFEIHTERVIM